MNFMNRIFKCAIPAAALAMGLSLVAGNARAAIVTFGAANFDNISQISTTGTLVEAVNINGSAVSLNTVNFAASSLPAFSDPGNFFDNTGMNGTAFAGTGGGTVSATLFADGERTSGASTPANRGIVTFSGLTIGNDYLIQLMSIDDRLGVNGRVIAVADSVPTLRSDYDLDNIDYTTGQGALVTGTFKANATSQTIYMASFADGVSTAEGGVLVQAFQLRETFVIPEPGTTGLALLAGVAVVGLKRRRLT